jgi:hypothetical protein
MLIGFAAADGGRDCKVPRSGLFHQLLKDRKYVESGRLRHPCKEVK